MSRGFLLVKKESSCPMCKNTFILQKVNTKYCSKKCQDRASKFRNRENIKKYRKEYWIKNREYYSKKHKEWIKNNRNIASWHAKKSFFKRAGIDLDRDFYNKMLEKQGGVCAICGNTPGTRLLHIDHDHRSSKLRGLLCSKCNTILGMCDDNEDILKSSIRYLLSW